MNQEYEENPVTALGGAPVKLLIIVGAMIYALTLLIGAYERQVGTVGLDDGIALTNTVAQLSRVQQRILQQAAVRSDIPKLHERIDDVWTVLKALDGVEVTDGTNAPSTNATEKASD